LSATAEEADLLRDLASTRIGISLERIAERDALSADLQPLPRERLLVGKYLAGGLLALTALVLVLIAIFAACTYPSAAETRTLAPTCKVEQTGCDLLENQDQRLATWFGNVKDLVQLLVVSLLIPLLATLIGYMFGGQIERDRSNRL
jgi:ABC-type Na+ efflux pump permease subunit